MDILKIEIKEENPLSFDREISMYDPQFNMDEFKIEIKEETVDEESQYFNNENSMQDPLKIDTKSNKNQFNYHPIIETSNAYSETVATTSENLKPYMCGYCLLCFEKPRELKIHISTHKKKVSVISTQCWQCNYTFENKKSFQKCSKCRYKTRQNCHLKYQKLTDTVFKCSKCTYKTNEECNLKVHKLSHTETKLLQLSERNYKANLKTSLKSQNTLTHVEAKFFKCSKCNFECKHRYSFKKHMLTHTNAKRFVCSNCSYECISKWDLKSHVLLHNVEFYQCSECGFECKQRNKLKKHMLLEHIL
ncbi:UNVERIFIED_CONTAM: hypothetical protein RMT77_014863 [Armadillidium vulgare]